MSTLRTNLPDVLARANANASAHTSTTLTASVSVPPKAGSSKFKPIKSSEVRKPLGSTLPSFTTPGFNKPKQDKVLGSAPQTKHKVVYVSDSTPSSPYGNGVKRTSSDPAFTSDASPQPLKRPKKSDAEDKENFPKAQKKVDKGKSKAVPLVREPTLMTTDDDLPPLKLNKSVEPNPFAGLDRDYPLPPPKKVEKVEIPPDSQDLHLKSPEDLTACLLHCHRLKNSIMEDIVDFHRGADKNKDIMILETVKDLLDNRIANIQLAQDVQSRPKVDKDLMNPTTDHFPPNLDLDMTDLTSGSSSSIPVLPATISNYFQPPFTIFPVAGPSLSTDAVGIGDGGDASDDEYWGQMQDVTMDDVSEVARADRTEDAPSSSSTLATSRSPSPPDLELTTTPFYAELKRQLQNVFHLENFRKNQLEATTAAMQGRDVFVLMPTGGGKSLCYQLPAVCTSGQRKGVTVVVTPLLALMNDQVNQLRNRYRLNALAWNSESSVDENILASGRVPMLYITPEKLQESNYVKNIFSRLYSRNLLARFVIDEAHCISTWGQDFRDAYTTLGSLRELYPDVPIMALTATANKTTVKDIIVQLKLRDVAMFAQSFNRPNLSYIIKDKMKNFHIDMVDMLKSKYRGQSGVIYCRSRQKCENLAETLQDNGIRAAFYHAGLDPAQRETTANDWQENRTLIVVATIAFGMGIDKADVRFVIHHDLPKSLSGYYQETGRAGRDGKPADCILYSSYRDYNSLLKMIQEDKDSTPEGKQRQEAALREVYNYVRNQSGCRRVQLLQHFDEKFDKNNCKNTCDTCRDVRETVSEDVTDLTRGTIQILKACRDQDIQVTLPLLLNTLRGSAAQDVKRKKLDMVPGYGSAKDVPTELVDLTLKHLMFIGVVTSLSVKNNHTMFHNEYSQLGPEADRFLAKKERLFIDWRPKAPGKGASKARKVATTSAVGAGTRKGKGKQKEFPDDPIELYDESSLDISDGERAAELIPQRQKRVAVAAPAPQPPPVAGPSRRIVAAPVSLGRKGQMSAVGVKVVSVSENDLAGSGDASGDCSDPVELYMKMCALRNQIMMRDQLEHQDDVFADGVLETLSLMCPSDYHSFKRSVADVMADLLGSSAEAMIFSENRWKEYGHEFLTLCVEHTTAPLRRAETAKKKVAELQSAYSYQGATTPSVTTPAAASSASATVRKAKFKAV